MRTTCTQPLLALIAISLTTAVTTSTHGQWLQWGGPNRDFHVADPGLSKEWPETGPKRLWSRELGDGYSSITMDGDVLYTMYRRDTMEYTIALDAQTGKTLWEKGVKSDYAADSVFDREGPGPNSTPLLCGERLFSIGTDCLMQCFEKKTGKLLWSHDFIEEYGSRIPAWGYAASPLPFENLVITVVDHLHEAEMRQFPELYKDVSTDKKGPTLAAFDQATGKLVWSSQEFHVDHSSPMLIEYRGQTHLVLLLNHGLMAINPKNGNLIWHIEWKERYSHNMTPIFCNGDTFICSGLTHTRAIRLSLKDGKTVPEEIWVTRKLRFPQVNPVLFGDYIVGSSGKYNETAVMLAFDVNTGKRLWLQRGFKFASCLRVGDLILVLDEAGTLALVTADREEMKIHAKAKVIDGPAWTPPTLVGKRVYLRNRKEMVALELP